MKQIGRRDFLKYASAAGAGARVAAATGDPSRDSGTQITTANVRISADDYAPVPDYPIRPQRHSSVRMADQFWKPRILKNAEVTIPFEMQKLAEMERGFSFNVLEAAILSLAMHPDARLQAEVDAQVLRLQQSPRAGNSSFEVSATHFATTGRRVLLDRAIEGAEALYHDFQVRNPPFSGGERDAINCVQLYRVTHDKRHLDLAKHYLDIRGLSDSVNRSRHNQSYKPVLEQSEAVGHAVNCVSLMVSLVDVGVLTGIKAYLDAAQRMWLDIVERKMYVTGGVGSTGNEGFGEPYSLPNISAYSETCAALMFITLNHRLFLASGDSRYIDVMERAMYNNAVDGVSMAGRQFFYVNRLASAGDGRDARWERASLECCPPNLVRFLAAMPGLVYAQDEQGAIYVNLYASSESSFRVGTADIGLKVDSGMPWSGTTRIAVTTGGEHRATIKLRIPGWARNQPVPSNLYTYMNKVDTAVRLSVNGNNLSALADAAGYVSIDRTWKGGDVVVADFPMDVRRVVADQRVTQDRRRVAIERGPLVYCAEGPDTDGKALDLLLEPAAGLQTSDDPSFYGGVTVIQTRATQVTNPSLPAKPIRLIPYSLWANRGPCEMTVWLSTAGYAIGDTGPAGGFIFHENTNYAADGWRYLEAAPFDQSAGAAWGCFRRLIPGARGTAVGTGKQNTADMLQSCSEPGTAAVLCSSLVLNGTRGWFLPSRDELALMYRHLQAAGLGDFQDGGVADNFTYWASSQQTADMAAHIDFADLGRQHGDDKDFPRRVRAVRMI
jgi:uncharacterized protein